MGEVQPNLVLTGRPGDRDRDYGTGIPFAHEGSQRLQQRGFETCFSDVRDVGLHLQVACQVHSLTMKVESACQRGLRTGDLKDQLLR